MVNQQELQGKWNDVKGALKKKWGSLTDDDVTSFNGNVDQLVGKIQQKTGETRDSIERFLNQATEDASGKLAGMRDKLNEKVHDRREIRCRHGPAKLGKDPRQWLPAPGQMVHDHPGQAIAAAFGLGLIVGVGLTTTLLHERPQESTFSRGRAATGQYLHHLVDKLSSLVSELKNCHADFAVASTNQSGGSRIIEILDRKIEMPKLSTEEAHAAASCEKLSHDSKEVAQELVQVAIDYARANPGYAALWCLGIGFVLGWKLKPW